MEGSLDMSMVEMPILSLTYQMQPPTKSTDAPPLVLLLHGQRSNEADLFALAPGLDPRFLVLSVRAPFTMGPDSYAWYRVTFTANGPKYVPEEVESSRARLIQFIGEAVAAFGADARRVYLMGFSQGAIMSEAVSLSRPDLVAGALLMSGRTLVEVAAQVAAPDALAGLPFLVIHGTQDTVLPIHCGQETRDLLETLPVSLTYREYPMPHTISAESLADATAWLTAQLDSPRSHG